MKKPLLVALCGILALTTSCKKEKQVEDSSFEIAAIDTMSVADSEIAEEPAIAESGDVNFDKMLDDYDEYVTEYIKFYKKAQSGDTDALTEYTEIMEKATQLQESMEAAQKSNKLSAEQVSRMLKIQAKMVQGMQ